MTIPDGINAAFEFTESLAIWVNTLALYRDKGYAGGRIYVMSFFWSWGIWNLYYYRHLNQTLSWAAGMSLCLANFVYLALMIYYGRKK